MVGWPNAEWNGLNQYAKSAPYWIVQSIMYGHSDRRHILHGYIHIDMTK